MKGLDTPILLRLLRGDERVRAFLRSLHGEELATTEWNLLELEVAVRSDRRPGRERRRAAVERLRRRLTVVPIDEVAFRAAVTVRGEPRTPREMIQFAILSALASRGCESFVTARADGTSSLRPPMKVQSLA